MKITVAIKENGLPYKFFLVLIESSGCRYSDFDKTFCVSKAMLTEH
jgi:hypothetical protein